jgi:hypothetical protein
VALHCLLSRDLLASRPVVVTVLLALLGAAWTLWSYAAADAKVATELLSGDQRRPIVVELRFVPEKFHMLLLQQLGRVESVQDRTIRLLDVQPQSIRAFARHYWVGSIKPASPQPSTGSAQVSSSP